MVWFSRCLNFVCFLLDGLNLNLHGILRTLLHGILMRISLICINVVTACKLKNSSGERIQMNLNLARA